MSRFNHAYTMAFTLISDDPAGLALNPQDVRKAISDQVAQLPDEELLSAIAVPFDTYEIDERCPHERTRR
jgi:hypothetical protein